MARPVLLDTDVMVDLLRGEPQAVALVHGLEDRVILSAMVVAELYTWRHK